MSRLRLAEPLAEVELGPEREHAEPMLQPALERVAEIAGPQVLQRPDSRPCLHQPLRLRLLRRRFLLCLLVGRDNRPLLPRHPHYPCRAPAPAASHR